MIKVLYNVVVEQIIQDFAFVKINLKKKSEEK